MKKKARKPSVGENVVTRIRRHADLFEDRSKVYGDNYVHFGKVMIGMFPDGVTLKSEADFARIGIFIQVMAKTTRYANNFARGGHEDSLDDNSVYSAMLAELDSHFKDKA